MNWMSKKDKQINFKRKFSNLNKFETFSLNPNQNQKRLNNNSNEQQKIVNNPSTENNRTYYKIICKIKF